jgi:hypothetical protein
MEGKGWGGVYKMYKLRTVIGTDVLLFTANITPDVNM